MDHPLGAEREEQLMEIVEGALAQPEAERAAWVELVCKGDTQLLREAAEALDWEQRMGGFMRKPILALTDPEPGEGPGSQIGMYSLVKELGEGGMGIVYQARQEKPIRREVALKIVKPGMDSRQVIARFEGERQALAMMDHPNIARVIEAGATAAGRPYFVMDLVEGMPITQYCQTHGLSPRQRLEVFLPVCEAIQHAHQKGIIHRDIKPSNILVEERDGRPVPKVIDFGIAKATEQRLTEATASTQVGSIVGTLEYMSPEQADLTTQNIDTRSDIYSLGVLLYKLLAGVTPLEGKTDYLEMLRAIREEDPPPPSARVGQTEAKLLRGELDWIVGKALEKDPNRRYETAAALARDIRRYLGGEPVEAGAPSATYILRKFAHRYRVWLGVAAAFLVILAAAAAISILEAVKATRAQQETKAVNDFLQNDLLAQTSANRQAQGGNRPDPDLKVRTLLDRAAAGVGRKFASQPLAEAAIRQTIGEAYSGLGLDREAWPHLERALELRRRLLGEQHPDTLASMDAMAGTDSDPQRGEALLRKTLEGRRRVLGPEHPDTLATMGQLGQFVIGQKKYGEAEDLLTRLLEVQRRVLGEESEDALGTTNDLANLYLWAGRPAQAEALFARLMEAERRSLGAEHPLTLLAMNNLGVAQQSQGKFAAAEALLVQVVEAQKRTMGAEHPVTLNVMDSLAMVYSRSGRYTEAEALFRKILDGYQRVGGEESSGTLITMVTLGDVYLAEGKFAEAEALMRHCLPILDRKAPQRWRRFFAQSLLGESLAGQKKFAEAEPLLVSGYEGMIQREAGVPPLNPRREREKMDLAGWWIVDLYRSWSKPEQAAKWQAKLEARKVPPKG
jgi:tetratricopeptide (TPR) repeat protein